jgi:hypothetical protein
MHALENETMPKNEMTVVAQTLELRLAAMRIDADMAHGAVLSGIRTRADARIAQLLEHRVMAAIDAALLVQA